MPKPLPMLDKVAEIKRLYYATAAATIQQDLVKAIDILRSMDSEAERERVAVYMDGLSEMRSDWAKRAKRNTSGRPARQRSPRRQR